MSIPFEAPSSIGTPINLAPEIAEAILKTIELGWEVARKRREVNPRARETAITECLRDGMRVASEKLPWRRSLIVLPGTESRSASALEPDGRTDIPIMHLEIFLRHGLHDPHAIIECKRIAAEDANLVREYVKEGVDRFCTGKYGGNHSKGFMAAYVLEGTQTEAVSKINDFLTKNARVPEHLNPENPKHWSSLHPRSTRPKIQLKHAFLLTSKR
ncbi:hypothetical protein [Bradyrhizobium sp. DOA9]|uniref:hypothetical protein n=1 Tax=Bradyrhizobium sp. DOA9 TaxID=1126627 RepID=UPI000469B2E8|nr:hypothetical protein [Bradyrhizobium sp. DOA9]GAJ37542.1 hypothetical protein BDOA9_0201590 [Bradyrhizobium sp. DOA9]